MKIILDESDVYEAIIQYMAKRGYGIGPEDINIVITSDYGDNPQLDHIEIKR